MQRTGVKSRGDAKKAFRDRCVERMRQDRHAAVHQRRYMDKPPDLRLVMEQEWQALFGHEEWLNDELKNELLLEIEFDVQEMQAVTDMLAWEEGLLAETIERMDPVIAMDNAHDNPINNDEFNDSIDDDVLAAFLQDSFVLDETMSLDDVMDTQ
jgi:hypothetical protein